MKREATKKSLKKTAVKSAAIGLSALAASVVPQAGARAQSINCFQGLSYGSILPCVGAATLTITPGGSVSGSGCLNYYGSQLSGRCLVIGSFFPVRPIQISVTGIPADISNGTKTMQVDAFNALGSASGPTITVTAFITVIDIGARLNVGGNQAAGSYSGSITVNANYLP